MAEDGGARELKQALTEPNGGTLIDNDDIIFEILARVPVKSLMRFRCVSKPFRALIADPYFVKKHFNYAERGITDSTSRLLFSLHPLESLDHEALKDMDDAQSAKIELDCPVRIPDYSEARVTILGSCNGLVCVLVRSLGVVLWNPCTRDTIVLPHPPTRFHSIFAFYGFGYDSKSDDYKLVYGITSGCEPMTQVFALKTGSWRNVGTPDNHNVKFSHFIGQGVLVNRALHWMVPSSSRVISFDFGEEKFDDRVPLFTTDFRTWQLLVFRDSLCAYRLAANIDVSDPDSVVTSSWTLWMMKEYGVKESWTRIMRFTIDNLGPDPLLPVCILENGAILMDKLVMEDANANSLVLINQNTVKTVFEADLICGVAIYRETLVSPPACLGCIRYPQ